ncbi:hypothetical protein HOI18_00555 [Candidatus Uhrbacteria bacterium]|jgi:hypothetical protein|nr:hypothetical protein [Candidatus Uhrbacteria bacterium]
MRLIIMLICLFVTRSAFAADCETVSTVDQLTEQSVEVERAFAEFRKEDLLKHASVASEQVLPCLGEVMTTSAAASFHRAMAFQAFFLKDRLRVLKELRAARRLEPGYAFPSDVVREGHPFLVSYKEASGLSDGDLQPVYPPKDGQWFVDGVKEAMRPSDTPVIVQVVHADGKIETVYVRSGDTLRQWSENPFGIAAVAPRRIDFKKPKPWYIAGASTALVGGVFYALAVNQSNQFNDTSSPDGDGAYDRLAGNMAKANGFGWTSVALGGVGAALGGVGFGFKVKFGGPKEVKGDE